MRLAVRSTVLAICLAIVALAPVAASARPALDPARVPINSTSTGEPEGHPPAIRANPDQQLVRQQAAVPIPPILGKTKAQEQTSIKRLKALHYTGKLPVNPAYLGAMYRGYGPRGPATANTKSPSTRPDNNGFDWGDAAIGAAAGLVLTLLVVGSGIALSHRRSPSGASANVATTA
jgi:hypothetical protein